MASTTSSSDYHSRRRRYDDYREPLVRTTVNRPRRLGPIVAWDIETDNIPDADEAFLTRKAAVRSRAMELLEWQAIRYAPIDEAIAQAGGVVASIVWDHRKRRFVLAGEWSDVPKSRYRKAIGRPGVMRVDGNLDAIADIAGWDEDAVMDALRSRRLSPIDAYRIADEELPIRDGAGVEVGVKYLTVHGADVRLSEAVDDEGLADVFVRDLFIEQRAKTRYVAWNANRFDTLFLLRALRKYGDRFIIRPFVAGQGGLRGARVSLRENEKVWWDLCDGIAMTGYAKSLAKFTQTFVPDRAKMIDAIDFSKESFDPSNPIHVAYAERDAEALYLAMMEVERICVDLTGRQLRMTIGATAIRLFQDRMPEGVQVHAVPEPLWDDLTRRGMRGGFVYVARQYDGPAWQYDANQAYGAAMRDARLPCGRVTRSGGEVAGAVGFYDVTVSRSPRSPIPFYCKTVDGPVECYGEPTQTFIASIEVETLRRHGWTVVVNDGWTWNESFSMERMIHELEHIRVTDPHGPNGPVGTMSKYLGCNAYGKTTERLSGERIVISDRPPEDGVWFAYRPEDEAFESFWVTVGPVERRRYHRPHLGATITAYVRMMLFDAIMAAPDAFLKCDTDSVCFDRPVEHLDIHPTRYGAWKCEYAGDRMLVVGKKVYAVVDADGTLKHVVCKGLNTKRLTLAQIEAWIHSGKVPKQAQVQTLGWRKGLPTIRYRTVGRRGTDFTRVAPHTMESRTDVERTSVA